MISEIQIIPVKPRDGLIAFASFVLDKQLYLGSIAVHTKLNGGYRLTYPTKQVGNRQMQIFHPITRKLGMEIEQAVITRLKEVMNKSNGGYDNYDY